MSLYCRITIRIPIDYCHHHHHHPYRHCSPKTNANTDPIGDSGTTRPRKTNRFVCLYAFARQFICSLVRILCYLPSSTCYRNYPINYHHSLSLSMINLIISEMYNWILFFEIYMSYKAFRHNFDIIEYGVTINTFKAA